MPKKNGPLSCIVADDEQDICQLLLEYLDELGVFKFLIPASDGQSAKQKILYQHFDLLIIDINMPKINGIELIRTAVETKKADAKNILIISGDASADNIKSAQAIGVQNFLVKPFDKDVFLTKVKSMLELE